MLYNLPRLRVGPQSWNQQDVDAWQNVLTALHALLQTTCTPPLYKNNNPFGPPNFRFESSRGDLFLARIVGHGKPTTTYLAAACASTDTSLTVGTITGQFTTLPPVPFIAKVGSERMTVTAVAGSAWTVTRYLTQTPYPGYAVGQLVEVVGSRPYAFTPVLPIQTTASTGGGWLDDPTGVMGDIDGAPITDAAAALFIAALGASSVSGSAGDYAGNMDTAAAYNDSDYQLRADGSEIVQLRLVPGEQFYRFSFEPLPFWAQLGTSEASTVATTLSLDCTSTASTITTAYSHTGLLGAMGFPPFPSTSQWTIQIGSERMLATYNSTTPGTMGTWSVTRGWDGTTPAAHSAGSAVTLIHPAYAWKEVTQDWAGRWVVKQGGRSSGAVPSLASNEPAYPVYPMRNPGGTIVLLRPGIAPASVPNEGLSNTPQNSRYWIFDWTTHFTVGAGQSGIVPGSGNTYLGNGERWVDELVIAGSGNSLLDPSNQRCTFDVDSFPGNLLITPNGSVIISASNSFLFNAATGTGGNGTFTVQGDIKQGHASSKQGFFGSVGDLLQTVSGSWDGVAAGESLAAALEAYGLITDSSSAGSAGYTGSV